MELRFDVTLFFRKVFHSPEGVLQCIGQHGTKLGVVDRKFVRKTNLDPEVHVMLFRLRCVVSIKQIYRIVVGIALRCCGFDVGIQLIDVGEKEENVDELIRAIQRL